MEIKYFNSNFEKITQNKDTDQSITNLIEKLPSLNIVSDKNLLEETIKISKQFKEKKEKINENNIKFCNFNIFLDKYLNC